MKKHVFLIALAGLMVLAACKKDKESQGAAQFTATMEHLGGRTSLDPNNGQILWTADDQIVIGNDNDETAIFSLQSGEGTTEGGFGTSDEFNTVGPFIAAYPSTAEIEGDIVTFNLPATQTIGETGTFANGANPMVAYSDDKNLQFKNLCGGLGIRLKGGGTHVSAVRITSKNTDEKLWGAYEVSNCAAAEPTLTVASSNQGSNVITLNCDVTLTTAAKTFFVMLPPGTLANGFTMEVLDGTEVLATKETTSGVAFVERNNMKCFNEILIDVEFDGNVEIPMGMDPSNIIVTNFSENAIPDENGDFVIGYSKMLVAKNADNGNIIYFSLNSIDENIRSEKSSDDNYEVNAKETAILFALRLLPFDMSHGDDEVLQVMKEIVYTLPCVQSLEDAVQNTVNNYGYLKEEGIENAISTVANFFYEQLSAVEPESTSREIMNPQQEQLAAPQFYPTNHKHGIELRIKDSQSQYYINPDRWTINCTGYSSLFCPVRIAAGHYDAMHEHFNESFPVHSYTMPPMSFSQYVKLAEKMSLLSMGGWAGWLELYRQMKLVMNDEEYLLQMTHVTLSNMTFELPRTTNAIGIMTPKDDEHARVSAVLYMVLDVLTAISPVPVPVENLVNAYLLDGEFLNYCKSQPHSLEGIQNISQALFDKLPDVFLTVGLELPLDMVNAFLKISNVCDGMDALISLLQSGSLSTFTLPVVAEYYGISLPTVHTSVINITTTTATVSGSVEGGASAAIVERGFVYGDMANSESIVITVGSGTGSFETTIENLITGHQYYVMAYAKLTNGEMLYGEEKTFTMYDGSLTVTTFRPSVVLTTAIFSGAVSGVLGNNTPTILAHGFSYKAEQDSEYTVINLGIGEIGPPFYATAEDLIPNASYHVIAFATIYESGNMITLYGEVVDFNTGNLPTVTTHEVLPTNIGDTWVTVTGSVVFPDPTQPIEYERGFVLGESPNGLTVNSENLVETYNGTELLNYSCTFSILWPNTPYYVRAYSYAAGNEVVYGNVVSFNTLNGGSGDDHDYVDLGLPSGTLWATCNVGADAPEGYGSYFAWGETQTKATYSLSTYQYCNGSYNTLTKYCNNSNYGYNGFTDNLTTLLPEDDAATANWGSGWRMPTKDEWLELYQNTTHTWTARNGINGCLFTASNGNNLFLPAAGCRFGNNTNLVGSYGYYWSSSLYTDEPSSAWDFYFNSGNYRVYSNYRNNGQSVRAVRSAR